MKIDHALEPPTELRLQTHQLRLQTNRKLMVAKVF